MTINKLAIPTRVYGQKIPVAPDMNEVVGVVNELADAVNAGLATTNGLVGGIKLVQYRSSRLFGVPADALTLDRLAPASIVPDTLAYVHNPASRPLADTLPAAAYIATVVPTGTADSVLVPAHIGAAAGDTVSITWQPVPTGAKQLVPLQTFRFRTRAEADAPGAFGGQVLEELDYSTLFTYARVLVGFWRDDPTNLTERPRIEQLIAVPDPNADAAHMGYATSGGPAAGVSRLGLKLVLLSDPAATGVLQYDVSQPVMQGQLRYYDDGQGAKFYEALQNMLPPVPAPVRGTVTSYWKPVADPSVPGGPAAVSLYYTIADAVIASNNSDLPAGRPTAAIADVWNGQGDSIVYLQVLEADRWAKYGQLLDAQGDLYFVEVDLDKATATPEEVDAYTKAQSDQQAQAAAAAVSAALSTKADLLKDQTFLGSNTFFQKLMVDYDDNAYTDGLVVRNKNTGPKSLTGLKMADANGFDGAIMQYVSPRFDFTPLANTAIFGSLRKTRLSFVANSSATDNQGQDISFIRISGATPGIFIEGSSNRVSINSASPTEALDVNGGVTINSASAYKVGGRIVAYYDAGLNQIAFGSASYDTIIRGATVNGYAGSYSWQVAGGGVTISGAGDINTTGSIKAAGSVTALSFSGNGSQLTGLPKAILYGSTGTHTDGAMTQQATTTELNLRLTYDYAPVQLAPSNEQQIFPTDTNAITIGIAHVLDGNTSRALPAGVNNSSGADSIIYFRAIRPSILTLTAGTIEGSTTLALNAGDWIKIVSEKGRNAGNNLWYIKERGNLGGTTSLGAAPTFAIDLTGVSGSNITATGATVNATRLSLLNSNSTFSRIVGFLQTRIRVYSPPTNGGPVTLTSAPIDTTGLVGALRFENKYSGMTFTTAQDFIEFERVDNPSGPGRYDWFEVNRKTY